MRTGRRFVVYCIRELYISDISNSIMPKWVFVTGGVLSGLGKGLVSASVSKLL